MTRKSKREVENALDEVADDAAVDATPADAYALLVAIASGTASQAERDRWRELPADLRAQVTASLDSGGER